MCLCAPLVCISCPLLYSCALDALTRKLTKTHDHGTVQRFWFRFGFFVSGELNPSDTRLTLLRFASARTLNEDTVQRTSCQGIDGNKMHEQLTEEKNTRKCIPLPNPSSELTRGSGFGRSTRLERGFPHLPITWRSQTHPPSKRGQEPPRRDGVPG